MNIEPFIKIAQEIEAIPTYIELEKYVDRMHGTDMFDFLVMYAKSLYLFTAGNVPTVRDASKYDPQKAEFNRRQVPVLVSMLDKYTDEISHGSPTKMDYRIAGMVLKGLAQRADTLAKPATKLYRGMHTLTPDVYMALCKPGEVYHLGEIASTSFISEIAENFSEEGKIWRLVYHLDNSKAKKGLYTSRWTSGFEDEDEVILGAQIRVKGFKWEPNWRSLRRNYFGNTPRQVTDMNNLIHYVNVFEKHIQTREFLAGTTIVYAEVL